MSVFCNNIALPSMLTREEMAEHILPWLHLTPEQMAVDGISKSGIQYLYKIKSLFQVNAKIKPDQSTGGRLHAGSVVA